MFFFPDVFESCCCREQLFTCRWYGNLTSWAVCACRNPDFAEMVLASAAIDWTLGRFTQSLDMYGAAIDRDPRPHG
jgi:hypothetical protein